MEIVQVFYNKLHCYIGTTVTFSECKLKRQNQVEAVGNFLNSHLIYHNSTPINLSVSL